MNLGRPFGIKVSVHWTFSLLILWIVFVSVNQGLEAKQILMHIVFVLTLFVCVLLHELGHSLAAIRLGGKVQSITLLPIGGMANITEMPEEPKKEFLMSAAGPLVNIVIAAALWIYLSVTSVDPRELEYGVITSDNFIVMLMAANIFIVIFNLIPAFPMDGGRLFRSALSTRMSRIKATRIAKDIGQVFAIIFIIAGFFANPFLIVIGFFIFLGAKGEYEMMKYRDILNNYTVADIVKTDYEKLDENDTLGTAADKVLHISSPGFVITSDGEFKSILTKNDLIKGLNSSGKGGKIKDIISNDIEKVTSDITLFDAFKKMQMKRYEMMPVIQNDKFKGVLYLDSINEFFLIKKAIN